MESSLPSGLYIVAGAPFIDELKAASAFARFDASVLVPLAANADIPQEVLNSASVLVLEVNPADAASMARIGHVRARRPHLPIIAALSSADVSVVRMLIREGVADVAALPFEIDDLASRVLDAMATLAERAPKPKLSPLFSVARSTGGCGTTTIITHLAATLAKDHGRRVCVIDMDLQNGDVATFLGVTPMTTITDLIEAGDRLDKELLANAVTQTRYGFSIIAAPEVITPLDIVDLAQLLKLLELVRRSFDVVIVDLPANWTNWALTVALESTQLLLVTDLSISSLRQARRRLQLFETIGVERDRSRAVINRVERRLFKAIGVDDARDALGCEVIASLAQEGTSLRSAQDQGVLVSDLVSKSKFVSDVQSLAAALIGER
jgi:pilus assembly protein CpaE